jgi:hypothetical protein
LLLQATEWIAARNAQEIIAEREAMIAGLEEANQQMWRSGLCQQWFEGADEAVRAVTKGVNGPLLAALLEASGYADVAVVELLRKGYPCFLYQCRCVFPL